MRALTGPRRWALSAHLLLLALAARAGAVDRVQECIGEHVEAQLLRNQGRLVQARARLADCATPACPALVRNECAALESEVQDALPSIIPAALDARGQLTSEPTLSVDGSAELLPLDGHPVVLDPGQHQLRFQYADGRVRDVTLVLVESEQGRRVLADFREESRDDGVSGGHGWTNVAYVSAGVAAFALGGFTYFALSGRAVQNELERCAPRCENPSDADRMRSRYLVADISLGIALVALGVGAYAWAQRPEAPPSAGAQGGTPSISLQPVATPRRVGLWATGEF
jgi:hypothetical protein